MKIIWSTTKRLLSTLLCICMVLSAAPLSASAAEYPTITPDVGVTFELNETVTAGIYAFTPEESGVYRFYTYDSTRDTYGYLLDADGNVLAQDDDGANSGNNFLIAYEMMAGTTYLLKARFYSEGAQGTMSMLLEKAVAPTAITIDQGDSFVGYPVGAKWFTHTLEPASSATLGVTWTADDPNVVDITEDGGARFMSPGTTTVTATTAEGLTATCEVTVLDPLPLKAGETVTATCDLDYHVTYSFIPEKTATYAFFTESKQYIPYTELRYTNDMDLMVVAYDENQHDHEFRLQHELTAGTEYYLYIFGQLLDATFDVTAEEVVPATAMTLDRTTLDVHLGGSSRLRPVYTPQNAIHEAITWKSSDDTVVSVDENGEVYFLKEGTATVTATSENGFTASCEITVGGYPTLSLCKTESTNIAIGGNAATYLFTPEKSGYYAFYAASDYDTLGYIYDATGETLLHNGDDYGDDRDFRLEVALEAGVTYRLQGRFYYGSQIGSMDLTMVRIDGNGNVIHDVSEYTVTDDSHSGVCDGCGEAVNGAHSYDENGNCLCGWFVHAHGGDAYDYDESGHWLACSQCGIAIGSREEHTYDEYNECVCGDAIVYGVYVGNAFVGDGEYLDLNGNVTEEMPAEGGYAHYADGVLTLNTFTFEGNGYVYNKTDNNSSVVFALNELTIELIGDNTIITEDDGITAYADLTIGGEGSLSVEGEKGVNVREGDLMIDGGAVTIHADCGIYAYYSVRVEEGVIDVTSTTYAVRGGSEIVLGENAAIKIPENGRVEMSDYCDIVDENGDVALEVVIKPLFAAGDVNRDGVLDTADVRCVLHHIVELTALTDAQRQLADVNKDGEVDSVDIRGMLLMISADA